MTKSFPKPRQITIASYDLASRMPQQFCAAHNFFICDEAHSLKSSSSNRSQALVPLVERARHALLLTGTPLQAKPIEVFPLVTPKSCSALHQAY